MAGRVLLGGRLGANLAAHDIIVIGASAGGVEVLTEIAKGLSGDLQAALFVVLHLPPGVKSALPEILSRNGPLPAMEALPGTPFERGHIS